MKKALPIFLMTCMLAFMLQLPVAHAENNPQVKLTTEQQAELAKLYKEKLEKEKQILDKYVEFKVFSEDTAKKILEHKENRYKHLEKNGYIFPKENHRFHQKKPGM